MSPSVSRNRLREAEPTANPSDHSLTSRVWELLFAAITPVAFQICIIGYFLRIAEWIHQARQAPSAVAILLALPPLLAELAFTRVFELRRLGWRPWVIVGLVGRLLVIAMLTYIYVAYPIAVKGTVENYMPENLRAVPRFLRILWSSSLPAAVALAALCISAYVWLTVRARRCRLTTTTLLPSVATFILFLLLYQFPASPLRGLTKSRPAFVTRVWTASHPDFRFPREVMITPDEKYAVATFGSTWPTDHSDLAPNDLGLDPRLCDPHGEHPADCRRNLALIDLDTGMTKTWTMPITRRFYSESFSDRAFVVPWHIHELLELDLDGTVHKYPLPETFGGERLTEVIATYHAPEMQRVYLVHCNNPVLLAWNERDRKMDGALSLVGWNGISLGDSIMGITRSPSRKRLYLALHGDAQVNVEVDETTLKPLRSFEPGGAGDLQISPDEKSIYAPSFLTGEIWRFDADTLQHVQTLDAPIQCRRLGFSPDGKLLFAASYLTGELLVFDAHSGARLDSFYVGPRLEGMFVSPKALFLLSITGLYRIPLDELQRRAAVNG